MFEEGQQTQRTQTNSKFKIQNNFITKPFNVYSSSLESRCPIEPTARPANQWEESRGTVLRSRCPPQPISKPLSQWERSKDQSAVEQKTAGLNRKGHQPRPEWNGKLSTDNLSECTLL